MNHAAMAQQLKRIHWIAYDKCGPFVSSGSAIRAGKFDVEGVDFAYSRRST